VTEPTDSSPEETATGPSEPGPSRDTLLLEVGRLREQNERLSEDARRAKQAEYRRAARGMGAVGFVALAGAVVLPSLRTVLVAFGAVGVFGGVLTYYLTPERFVSTEVSRDVYSALNRDRVTLVTELGLSDHRVYVPLGETSSRVCLFVPQADSFAVPEDEELDMSLTVPENADSRGLAFTPSGSELYESFVETTGDRLEDDPISVANKVGESLTEQFDLVDGLDVSTDVASDQLTVALGETAYGPVDDFDHPVVSMFAVGLARTLEQPVETDVSQAQDSRFDVLVTYRWGQ